MLKKLDLEYLAIFQKIGYLIFLSIILFSEDSIVCLVAQPYTF